MIKKTNCMASNLNSSYDQFDSKCICQICTCHKHKCPHSNLNIPFEEISTYQKEFIKHPLTHTQKFNTDNGKYLNTSYGYINSSYREDYPGHKPQMRQKIVPRVKDEDKNVPFQGTSLYRDTFTPKRSTTDKMRKKDNQFNPCTQPFQGMTTYNSDFIPKRPFSQVKKRAEDILFPEGYKFNPNTTYTNDFIEKHSYPAKSFKPVESLADKGKHFLNSTYRDDYTQKKSIDICPVLTLPKFPNQINYPNQHVSFNKTTSSWQGK